MPARHSPCSLVAPVLLLLVLLLLLNVSHARADVKLPSVIGSNMVLQRDRPLPIWGWAEAGENVTVTLDTVSGTAVADANGRWALKLPPQAAGGPHTLTVAGKNTLALKNILIGEVWLCSGQSNMAWVVGNSKNAAEETQAANHPQLRLFTVPDKTSLEPLSDCVAQWAECSPKSVNRFSAVAYYFGRDLQRELGVPVGLLNISVGNTPAESWATRATLAADPDLQPILTLADRLAAEYPAAFKKYEVDKAAWTVAAAAAKAANQPAPPAPTEPKGPLHPHMAGTLYNGMIAPVIPFAIRGACWYQGESNVTRSYQYRKLLPAMIDDWRKAWAQPDMTFLIVQLANYRTRPTEPVDSGWAQLRHSQWLVAKQPHNGLAVTIDIGDGVIHPLNKQDVGYRLSLSALHTAYGKDVVYSGPDYDAFAVEGSSIRLKFKHLGGGLVARGDKLIGFSIAGEDQHFVWAEARIEGDTIVVQAAAVAKPVAVRYAWAENPECNLYNKAGLPASPFRTDDWPGNGFTNR